MKAKFTKGDSVRFTDRASNVAKLHKRTRTIVDTYYSKELQATLYEIGGHGGKHHSGQWFRSYELYLANGHTHKIGRPKAKLRLTSPNQKLARQTGKAIPKPP